MSDQVEVWRAMDEGRKAARAALGVKCPECVRLLPRAHPTILLPQQRCKIHNYRDQRPESVLDDWYVRTYGSMDAALLLVPLATGVEAHEAIVDAMLQRWEGAPCAACGVPMTMDALQDAVGSGTPGANGLPGVMHLACYRALPGDKTGAGEMSP